MDIKLRQTLDSIPQGTEYEANIFADDNIYVCSGRGSTPLEAINDARENLSPDMLTYTPVVLVVSVNSFK